MHFMLTSKANGYLFVKILFSLILLLVFSIDFSLSYICQSNPNIQNAIYSCSNVRIHSTCYYTCESGYVTKTGSSHGYIECKNFNSWETADGCVQEECALPPYIPHAGQPEQCSHMKVNEYCPITCEVGYESKGSSTNAYCIGPNQWNTDSVNCKQIPDTCINPPNSGGEHENSSCSFVNVGFQCYINCVKGYRQRGENFQTCISTEKWYPNGTCDRIVCDKEPQVNNANAASLKSCTTTKSGDTCHDFKCNDGYYLEGVHPKCSLSGDWDTINTKCMKITPCYNKPNINNAFEESLIKCNATQPGKECDFTCDSGYLKLGKNPECQQNGSWSQTKAKCEKIVCINPPIIENVDNDSLKHCANVYIGFMCEYTCEYYSTSYCYTIPPPCFSRPSPPICLSSGEWEIKSGCGKNMDARDEWCDKEPQISNANVTSLKKCTTTKFGNICSDFKCNSGYNLKGDFPKCSLSGDWDTSYTKCVEIIYPFCYSKPNINNAFEESLINCNASQPGKNCDFTCNPGYFKFGQNPICQQNGEWSQTNAKCNKITSVDNQHNYSSIHIKNIYVILVAIIVITYM